jgi:hypothetical protein
MSKPITNVSLKFPCMEDWNKMDTSSGERICGRCQHKVIDFTNMNDEEFQKHLKSAEHVCGRFKKSQLSNEFLKYAAATLIAASTIGAASCDTVEPNAVEVIPPVEIQDEEVEFVTAGIVFTDLDTLTTDAPEDVQKEIVTGETKDDQ